MRVERRGEISLQYAMLIAAATAALIGMSVYWSRSLRGNWRQIGDTFGYGRQYEPGVTRVTETRNGR